MAGDWNRRVEGLAASGWGWPGMNTGSPVAVTFTPEAVFVNARATGTTSRRGWHEFSDLSVSGPGTVSRQGYSIIPLLSFNDVVGSAVGIATQQIVKKLSTTTTTRTFLSLVGPGFELVLLIENVDPQPLRWMLAPAFARWRAVSYEARLLLAAGRIDELDPVQGQEPELA